MKLLPIILGGLLVSESAHAAVTATTFGQSWTGTLPVPDNSDLGVSSTFSINAPGLNTIVSVEVAMRIEGGWNGDFYAYLVHNGRLAILLNRPGRTATNNFGFGSTSLEVLFSGSAATDVHTALPDGGSAIGIFQPDGRDIDPLFSLDTTPRTKMLGVFTELDPNGDWTLFVADQGAGDTGTLKSWTLTITAVPEPSVALLGGLTSLFVLRRRRA